MPGRLSDRHDVKVRLRRTKLHTVCEEARCPNIGECFSAGTATFLVLGNVCTRRCGFCAVWKKCAPGPLDEMEPMRVSQAVEELGLRHAVITSVTRDDLADGGSALIASCIREIRKRCPKTTIEVLVPDFMGQEDALDSVLRERPDVFNHNIETVPRLYPQVRSQADYGRSLRVISRAASGGGMLVKSGMMVGLGESREETAGAMSDLAMAGCQVLTIGQYLQPARDNVKVVRRYTLEEFQDLKELGERAGIKKVIAGPLVRSSYRARDCLNP
jgi:lipoyl synthase